MRQDKNPPHMSWGIWKNVSKNCRVPLMSSSISVSIPKHMNVRMRSSSSGHTDRHTRSEAAAASNVVVAPPVSPSFFPPREEPSSFARVSSSAMVSTSPRTLRSVLETMNPVLGCTMPAVPPTPRTLCGSVGNTPPIGIRQYSSSSTLATSMPMCASRSWSFTFKSSNSKPGRSTRLVSSKKILFGPKGIAYRNVGWSSFIRLYRGLRCASRQSMKSISSSGRPCGSTVSHKIPNAAWYPGVNSRSNSTSLRTWPVASRTSDAWISDLLSVDASRSSSSVGSANTTLPSSSCSTASTASAPKTTPASTHRLSSLSLSLILSTCAYGRSRRMPSGVSSSITTLALGQTRLKQSSRPSSSNSSTHTP